jgi:Dolichyl-phosphate-mannose-protein mannosyltransferase
VLGAFGVRSVGLKTSFELWVDEMLYAELGASVARGELPNLPDGPFFLHPPGFFVVEAIAIRLFGLTGNSMDLVYQVRWVSAVCGALSVGLLFLVLRRPAGVPAAFVAGGLAIFEPFVLRNNSRVFLETTATLPVLLGLLIVVERLAHGTDNRSLRGTALLAVAGLAMGYGIFTKDVIAITTFAPVALAALWRKTLARRDAAVLLAAMVVPYATYLCILGATGYLGNWYEAKSQGALRMLGFVQDTGFNAPNAPSLVSRVLAQLEYFGTSYVLLLACPIVGAVAALSARPERRFIGCVAVMMGLFGVYSAAFGTFEEQYGYPVMIAGIAAAAVSAVELYERYPFTRRAITVVCPAFMVAAMVLGIRAESTTDDGFLQVHAWADAHLVADARIGVTNSTAELAYADDPRFGAWASLPALAEHNASYVVTQSLPMSMGYGYARPELLPWLTEHATPLVQVPGLTNGVTTLWYIGPEALESGARDRIAYPSHDPEQ